MDQRMGELAVYEESLAIRRRLARIDPSNAQWRHDEACILDGMEMYIVKSVSAKKRSPLMKKASPFGVNWPNSIRRITTDN